MSTSFLPCPHVAGPLPLRSDEVHVWNASLKAGDWRASELLAVLSADERARAAKFRFEKDRDRFIIVRGLLRRILSRYLDLEPEFLRFQYNSFGKPALTEGFGGGLLRFNVSHAGNLALYAVSNGREIGIDVEQLRNNLDFLNIAKSFFSNREAATLNVLPLDMQVRAFFNCWTRKESYIKAQGQGLSLPLDQFEISLIPGQPARLLNTSHNAKEAYRWELQDLPLDSSHYVASIAVEGNGWQAKYWQWQP